MIEETKNPTSFVQLMNLVKTWTWGRTGLRPGIIVQPSVIRRALQLLIADDEKEESKMIDCDRTLQSDEKNHMEFFPDAKTGLKLIDEKNPQKIAETLFKLITNNGISEKERIAFLACYISFLKYGF